MTDISLRIPNLPLGPITDKDGNPTASEQIFRQALIDLLQNYLSQEGLVIPAQEPDDITLIQNALSVNGVPTCQIGTMLYKQDPFDYTQDKVVIAVRTSDTPGSIPLFKTFTIT